MRAAQEVGASMAWTENGFEDQLDLEYRTQRIAGASADFREGVAAFLEKRAAKFKGI